MPSGFLKTYFHVMTQSYTETPLIFSLFFFFFGLTEIPIQKTLVLRELVINFKSSILWRCKYDTHTHTHTHIHTHIHTYIIFSEMYGCIFMQPLTSLWC